MTEQETVSGRITLEEALHTVEAEIQLEQEHFNAAKAELDRAKKEAAATHQEKIKQIQQRFNEEQERLRTESPAFQGSVMDAITHYYGSKLLDHPDWVGAYKGMEQKIQAAAHINQYDVPMLLLSKEKSSDWEGFQTYETDRFIFALIDPHYSKECFLASAKERTTSAHAFTSQQLQVVDASLALRCRYADVSSDIRRETCKKELEIEKDLTLARSTFAKDGPRWSISEYAYSDSSRSIFINPDADEYEEESCAYECHVGWDELQQFICRHSGETRLRLVRNLRHIFHGLGQQEFSGIGNALGNALEQISQVEKIIEDMETTLKTSIADMA